MGVLHQMSPRRLSLFSLDSAIIILPINPSDKLFKHTARFMAATVKPNHAYIAGAFAWVRLRLMPKVLHRMVRLMLCRVKHEHSWRAPSRCTSL